MRAHQMYERAVHVGKQLLETHPGKHLLQVALGTAYLARAEFAQARRPCRECPSRGGPGCRGRPRDAQSDPRLEPSLDRDSVVTLEKALIECVALAERDANLTPTARTEAARAYAENARSWLEDAARRANDDAFLLETITDHLTTMPVAAIVDPRFPLALARKAVELTPEDGMARQSLAWAQYRNGDWKGCIESQTQTEHPDEGGFFLAMAYHQLGDKDQARSWFDRAAAWLVGYEKLARSARGMA